MLVLSDEMTIGPRGEPWLRVLGLWPFYGVPEAMQLRDYSSFFRPEEFHSLTAAYDAAWQELMDHEAYPLIRSGPCSEK